MKTSVTTKTRESSKEPLHLEQLKGTLNRYCLSLTGSIWEAEDLAQNTWLKALPLLQNVGHLNPEAFLLRIAKNTWIDQVRRSQVVKRLLQQKQMSRQNEELDSDHLEIIFSSLLTHLSPLQMAVFMLRDVFTFTANETAQLLQTTEGAVKSALHRAHKSLEKVQEELLEDGPPIEKSKEMTTLLSALSAAYRRGDISTLLRLIQHQERSIIVSLPPLHPPVVTRSRPTSRATIQMVA